MKIYPSIHDILQTSEVDLKKDIPLAYIDTESKEYQLNIIQDIVGAGNITPVLPYEFFDTYEVALFKPNNKTQLTDSSTFYKISNQSILQRNGSKYQYIPLNSITFDPETFDYEVIVKKQLKYSLQNTYNMMVGVIDYADKDTAYLANKLIKVFGDAPLRGICPNNVWINNRDLSVNSLSNKSIKELDFLFVASKDGSYIKYDTNTNSLISVNDYNKEYLTERTNVWVAVENFPVELVDKEIAINSPTLYSSVSITDKTFKLTDINDKTFIVDDEDKEQVTMHTISTTDGFVIIKEYKEKGFMIYSSKSFFDNIEKNISALYEVMFYVYKQTYLKSDMINQWITDVVPDYVVSNNKLTTIDKFLSIKPIHEFFNLNSNDVIYSSINISKENVKMKDLYNNYLTFEKLYTGDYEKYADPEKEGTTKISIYTPQRQIMYFDDFVYKIQDDITSKLQYERVNNTYVIKLRGFKNTYYNIDMPTDTTADFVLPLTRTVNYEITSIEDSDFYVCINNNILTCCGIDEYLESFGVQIAKINISKVNAEPKLYDMRRRGGGLPEGYKDDYNLLDIGHIYGLAYRKAGTIIITLPTRLKQYDNIIKDVVYRHIVAEKLPIILYED